MRKLITFLLLLITYCGFAQQRPTTLPAVSSSAYYRLDTGMLAKMQMFVEIDTFSAKNPTLIKHLNHNWYFTNGGGTPWYKLVDTSGLSARINQKLNIADSITKYITPKQLHDSLANVGGKDSFSNGLTKTGNQVTLGGALNQTTVIDLADQAFAMSDITGSSINSGSLEINDQGALLAVYDSVHTVAKRSSIIFNQSFPPELEDNIFQKGLYYPLNTSYWRGWSASDSNVLATKSYVDSGNTVSGFISSLPGIGDVVPVGTNFPQWFKLEYQKSQAPTGSLSGGTTLEITTSGTQSKTVSWIVNRLTSTALIDSIVITGPSQRYNQTFSQPSAPGSVSGSQSVTITNNATNTFTLTVYTHDGKVTNVATTSYSFQSKYYIGYVSSNTPSDADLLSATGGTVGGVFATQRQTSGTLSTPASSSYIVFSYPASFGTTPSNSITIGGFATTYNLTVRNVVNASGATVSYNVYVSPFPTNSGVSYQVQ